ncbi:DNA mismatch repair endonuclease MutL [Lactonifactor longoviformis]|uniref:DNA mismatch repair protein MutL n=3 Tax=Lactonifactor TaxID=420345 RepID=A0A1M4ZK19_9CLOT|nr:DNA mismatch repair endonuclease MutL [Lactonifactor longoviformis]SHF18389.1 DNA mismatch repair protein MutL [Lactonifactor longoviformis DSM 17459]
MRKIAVLDKSTIDKIAAGEVVERPASVVKELVENAIDAGATAVTVEIKEGGISFIRITDNGSGMEKEQVPLAFLRHATSKIASAEDLTRISSLGFRGEALSSIAAVSQVELITKTVRELTGTRYVIEGGEEKALEEIGAPNGTTFLVRNLFFNTPVRAKFLKSPVTEANYVSSFMEQLALSHSDISFKYISNGQTKLHTSGNNNLKDVIYHIYGRDITRELMEIQWERNGLAIQGYMGKPSVSRGNRNFENYYVNGRYVKSKIIMKAIEDAYKPFLMQHKYPFVSLHLTMEGEDLDVNVHPTKMEVRFSSGQEVYQAVYQALLEQLTHKELIPEVSFDRSREKKELPPPQSSIPEPFEKQRIAAQTAVQPPEETAKTVHPAKHVRENTVYAAVRPQTGSTEERPRVPREQTPPLPVQPQAAPEEAGISLETAERGEAGKKDHGEASQQLELFEEKLLSPSARSRHRIIGQLFDTYWLVEYDNKFYIIDQHAAHEKVLYERIMKDLQNKEIHSQYLSPPLIIELSIQEEELLRANMEVFASFGFEIESFGGRGYSIRAVPSNLYGVADAELFLELLDHLEGDTKRSSLELLTHRLATMACKAAVKGNQTLSCSEADRLIEELLTLDNPYHCPHGRPTIIAMTKYELEKKFKRIV